MRHLILGCDHCSGDHNSANRWLKRFGPRLGLAVILILTLSPLAGTHYAQDKQRPVTFDPEELLDRGLELFKEGSKESLQEAVKNFNLALAIFQAIKHPSREVITLSYLASSYNRLGENRKALDACYQALQIYQAIKDRAGEATLLNNIGVMLSGLGEKQKALEYLNKALQLEGSAKNSSRATTLLNIGAVYRGLNDYSKAVSYLTQALEIYRKVNERPHQVLTLYDLGKTYFDARDYEKALDHFGQALRLLREAGIQRVIGATSAKGGSDLQAAILNGMGEVHYVRGENQKSFDYFSQARSRYEAVKDLGGQATMLTNIGSFYLSLGEYQKALNYYGQAVPLRRAVHDRLGEAVTLNNIGQAYNELRKLDEALEFYGQALAVYREINDRFGEALTLGNIGSVYHKRRQQQEALEFQKQALVIYREIQDPSGEATALNGIGQVYYDLGKHQEARNLFDKALLLFRTINERPFEASLLGTLMYSWKDSNPSLAIFYGKQAVNAYQQLRANIRGLDKSLQQTFLRSKADKYRQLADLLIATGRLPEAQQVLEMLKEEEYFQFVRGDSSAADLAAARIAFTPAEADLEKRFNELIDRIVAIGSERGALLNKARRTPDEERLLSIRERDLVVANRAFEKFLDQLNAELKELQPGSKDVFHLREAQALMNTLRDINAVALYTVMGKDYYRVILITPDTRKAYEYPIKDTELRHKVAAFRQALQDRIDPLAQAQELYRILIGPELARDLSQVKTQTLMWSLDDALRYLPIAALHDGQGYMIERYRNVVFTPASHDSLKDRVSPKWQALGLGVSKGEVVNTIEFPPLPGVREELAAVVRDENRGGEQGALPGKVMLNEDFTAETMKTALRLRGNDQPYKLVHIASHFKFVPGDISKSFLLVGGGKILTLSQLREMPQVFGKVELLTLSACDTATGGIVDGKEVEGFAVLAQRQGAEAIIATLWPVRDPSTSQLMQQFYRLRDQHSGMSKAEALRQAQLELLRSGTDFRAPFAHPYYWAPFILIGNWR